MLAAIATAIHPDDPLAGLVVGERPEPVAQDGWVTVSVKAASLNHHDLWTLKGVGISEDQLPMVLGCDAAGIDDAGDEVIVHSVIASPEWRGDETLDPRRSLALRALPRHAGREGDRAQAQRGPQAGRAVLRGGGLPADGLAHGLPHAVRAERAAAG